MTEDLPSKPSFRIASGLAGITGVVLLAVSFAINASPPPAATGAELIEFGQQHYANVLWGAWLQHMRFWSTYGDECSPKCSPNLPLSVQQTSVPRWSRRTAEFRDALIAEIDHASGRACLLP
jgi:hypothetical protein